MTSPFPLSGAVMAAAAAAAMLAVSPIAASAKDSLGIFSGWGAFRDPQVPRCYAIAMAQPTSRSGDYQPFASVGTWPRKDLRNQLHLRLSRKVTGKSTISLRIGASRFELTGGGGDAWAKDKQMDAAIVAAMRSAPGMTLSARDEKGRRFYDSYDLEGAATAMDAATLGCAKLK